MASLEDILDEMSDYGKPRLLRMDKLTWYASLDVFVTGSGIAFKIDSEMHHAKPKDAAQECLDRMRAALRDVTKLKQLGCDK